jgi:septum site-determining protein MinC
MMSTTKDSGAQTNPEPEQGASGDLLSTQRPPLPIPVSLNNGENGQVERDPSDQDQPDQAQANEINGAGIGVNGLHHSDGDGTGEGVSEATITDEMTVLTGSMTTPRSAVKIKGRPGGVSLELGEGEWGELILLLEERLKAAEGFFRGGRVLLDVGARLLVEEELRQVRQLLEVNEMQLAVVRSTAERTLQAAAEVGLSTTIEETQESLQVPEPPLIVDEGPPNAYTPSPYVSPPEAVAARPNHFVYRGSLRSGQVLRKTESIVVIGDVNPGAQVISGGDIMVWGRLRGIAHAGAEGNRRSVVAAIDFVPTQLRIANLTAIAPDQKRPKARGGGLFFWKKEPERRPEIARVIDGRIVVEPWDEGKPTGLGVWRK